MTYVVANTDGYRMSSVRYCHSFAFAFLLKRRVSVVWLISLLSATVSFGQTNRTVSLTLLPAVTVDGEWILMSDLVRVSGANKEQWQATLEGLVVARAPSVSSHRLFTQDQLRKRLTNFPQLILGGATEVDVKRHSLFVSAQDIRHALLTEVEHQLQQQFVTSDQYRVKGLERIHDRRVPVGEGIHIQVDRFQPDLPSKNTTAWVDILSQEKRLQSLSIPLTIDIVQPVWVATRFLKQGNVIGANDLSEAIKPNSDLAFVTVNTDVIGLELQQDIAPGDPIPALQLASASTYSRGELVLAKLQTGVVSLQIPVKLLAPANIGETILAERQNGRKVKVWIADNGEAQLVGKYDEQ